MSARAPFTVLLSVTAASAAGLFMGLEAGFAALKPLAAFAGAFALAGLALGALMTALSRTRAEVGSALRGLGAAREAGTGGAEASSLRAEIARRQAELEREQRLALLEETVARSREQLAQAARSLEQVARRLAQASNEQAARDAQLALLEDRLGELEQRHAGAGDVAAKLVALEAVTGELARRERELSARMSRRDTELRPLLRMQAGREAALRDVVAQDRALRGDAA